MAIHHTSRHFIKRIISSVHLLLIHRVESAQCVSNPIWNLHVKLHNRRSTKDSSSTILRFVTSYPAWPLQLVLLSQELLDSARYPLPQASKQALQPLTMHPVLLRLVLMLLLVAVAASATFDDKKFRNYMAVRWWILGCVDSCFEVCDWLCRLLQVTAKRKKETRDSKPFQLRYKELWKLARKNKSS